MRDYLILMRLDKPIGILLLLWPTLWALWLANQGRPDPLLVSAFIAGVILMRSAGCVINDIADRHYDPMVSRTRLRPLAAGRLSLRQAGGLFLLLLLGAASLLVFLNPLTCWLAVAGALLAVVYPFLKRFTHLPQLGLGAAFSWGVPMAFAACQGKPPASAFWPFASAFFWTVMYDTLYAMVDRADDIKAGVHSTARLFGQQDRRMIGLLQLVTLACLIQTGRVFHLKPFFYFCVLMAGLLFLYQQWLIRHRDPAQCFQAFLNNHWVGLILFAGILI